MTFDKYTIITTDEMLLAVDAYLEQQKPQLIAIDTETTGLDFLKNPVIGVSFSLDSKSGFYVPLLSWVPDKTLVKSSNKGGITAEFYPNGCLKDVWTGAQYPENVETKDVKYAPYVLEFLKRWFYESKVELIMHNAVFDALMIETSLGFDLSEQIHCDTLLLKHVLDENTPMGLKETALLWSTELGIPVDRLANAEQIEMGRSVLKNGGRYSPKIKHVWRGDLDVVGKYAIADTFLTYGLYEVGIDKLQTEYEPKHLDWFFRDEVMPLCREVVIPMKRRGVRIDVPYFEEMAKETKAKMDALEDAIIQEVMPLLTDFNIGVSRDDVVSTKTLIEALIEAQGLEHPMAKGKPTLAKAAVQKAFAASGGHWLWGYILGENELPFTDAELDAVKQHIYEQKTGKRTQFNIGSDMHLRWLFCTKLGVDPFSLPQTESATKTHAVPSMKAGVLKDHFVGKYPWVKKLLLYKKLNKLYGTYIIPAITLQHDGYLHMDMMQAGTVSGRFACRGGFNLQTLPKVEDLTRCKKCESKNVEVTQEIRLLARVRCKDCGDKREVLCPSAIKAGFIAPEGHVIVNADFSAIEPRCFAYCSGDTKLKAVYWDGLDLYSKVYLDIFGGYDKYSANPKDKNYLKKLAEEKRTFTKPFVLSVPYGARAPQVAKQMGFKKTITDKKTGEQKEILDVAKGKELRDNYLNAYPDLRKFMETQQLLACTQGYVETLIGRRRHYKFAQAVFLLLQAEGKDIEWLLDLKRKDLETRDYSAVFCKENLLEVLRIADVAAFDAKTKVPRNWAFVKALFKNEIDNANNVVIQGLAAHIVNRAMLECNRIFKKEGVPALTVLSVHDENTCYVTEEYAEIAAAILKVSMEDNIYAKLIDIDMVAEPLISKSLKDSK